MRSWERMVPNSIQCIPVGEHQHRLFCTNYAVSAATIERGGVLRLTPEAECMSDRIAARRLLFRRRSSRGSPQDSAFGAGAK